MCVDGFCGLAKRRSKAIEFMPRREQAAQPMRRSARTAAKENKPADNKVIAKSVKRAAKPATPLPPLPVSSDFTTALTKELQHRSKIWEGKWADEEYDERDWTEELRDAIADEAECYVNPTETSLRAATIREISARRVDAALVALIDATLFALYYEEGDQQQTLEAGRFPLATLQQYLSAVDPTRAAAGMFSKAAIAAALNVMSSETWLCFYYNPTKDEYGLQGNGKGDFIGKATSSAMY